MRLEYFEMVDKVEAMDLERGTIRVTARTPQQSPVFEGHFPGFPVLPGVMMLETMNHAAGYLIYWRFHRAKFVFLGSVKRAKFRRFVKPGALLVADAKLSHEGSGFCVAETILSSQGDVVADAEIVMIVTDFPSPEVEAALAQRSDMLQATAPSGP